MKLGSTQINKVYLGATEAKKVYLGTNLILDNGTIDTVVTINTTSVSPTWTPYVENSGATLTWEVTGGVTRAPQVIDTPILNLEANTGTAIITITSSTAFAGFTVFKVDSLDVSAIDTSAIGSDMVEISCKDNAITTWDISSMTGLLELTFRTNPLLTAMDISSNTALTSIWGYSTALTALDVSANNSLTYLSMDNCALTTAELDAIINDLDDNGASNGTLFISGNTGLPLTVASFTGYTNLEARGWTINVANSTPVDTENPAIGTLYYANETSTTVELTCTATDNVGVVSFDIYLDAVLDRNVLGTSLSSYEFDGLTSETNYDIFAVAKDAADNESSPSNIINFTTDAAPTTDDGLHPTLTNFRILDAQKGRVYFDSSEIITASTGVSGYTGFTITGKVISQITINTDSLTNHYFDVTVDFDFYSNNTIRYEGGSDLADSESNALYNFTLQYITNSITEPSTSSTYYVDKATGSNGDNGTTEGLAWETITYAATQASAGDLIYIKAANYGAENVVLSTSGNLANPIIFEGYTTTPGDAPSLTRALGLAFDSAEMPLLTGNGSGNGIYASLESYIIIRNIQIENYDKCIFYDSNSYCILDNVYLKDAEIALQMTSNPSNNLRVLNSYIADCTGNGMWNYGTHHLINNTWVVSSKIVNMDYHIAYQAGASFDGYHIIKDCYIHAYWNDSHGDHGISLKGGVSRVIEYTLIEDCTLENNGQGIECRHEHAKRNVIRGCYGTRETEKVTAARDESTLITFRDGCSDNIVENCTMEGLSAGVLFNDNAGEEGSQAGGIDNKVINCVFNNNDSDIVIKNGIGGTALEPTGNDFTNCTFYNSNKLVANSIVPFGSSNIFTNCILESIPAYDGTPTFRYSDFYVSFPTPSGVGNISVKPYFTDAPNGDFSLSSETTDEVYEGGIDNGVYYDITDIERKTPFSMGAYEKQQEETPVLSNFNITNSEPTKVYFNSSSSIIGMTVTDFTISGKSIDSLSVNGASTVGHYFTVTSAFDFWDNNTIRLNSDNVVRAFTLEYIANNIDEPTATTNTYYVTTSGNDSNDGLSEGNAWLTWQKAFSTATAGSTVWIKAGLYQGENVVAANSGSTNSPIKYKGYKTTIGDITSMYYAYGDGALDDAEMPHLDGQDDTLALHYGLEIIDKSFIIIENIQIDGYTRGYSGRHPNVILDNCLVFGGDNPASQYQGAAILINSQSSTPTANSDNNRILNCLTINGGVVGLQFAGNHNLVLNHKQHSDTDGQPSTDYYYHLSGSNNILLNAEAHRIGNLSHSGHGIGFKSVGYTTEYNLVENCLAVNIGKSFYVRWSQVKYNVFRGCEAYGYAIATDSGNSGGINLYSGPSYNTFENMYLHTVAYGIQFYGSTEDSNATSIATNNTFKNVIIDNASHVINTVNYDQATYQVSDNHFYNCTFNDSVVFWRRYNSTVSVMNDNLFTNCIIKDIPTREGSGYSWNTTTDTVWDWDNFFNSWGTEGNNISTYNPNFIDEVDFIPQEVQMTAPKITGVDYDYNKGEREDTTTIGAVKLLSE